MAPVRKHKIHPDVGDLIADGPRFYIVEQIKADGLYVRGADEDCEGTIPRGYYCRAIWTFHGPVQKEMYRWWHGDLPDKHR